jgi:hypothetical protein
MNYLGLARLAELSEVSWLNFLTKTPASDKSDPEILDTFKQQPDRNEKINDEKSQSLSVLHMSFSLEGNIWAGMAAGPQLIDPSI